MPDNTLTPGFVVANCARPQDNPRSVSLAEKNAIDRAYHYSVQHGLGEYDHRVPNKMCGDDTTVGARGQLLNVWPQPNDDSTPPGTVLNRKDQLESAVYTMLRHGTITIVQAIALFLPPNDWRHVWCVYVHKAGDGVTCDV